MLSLVDTNAVLNNLKATNPAATNQDVARFCAMGGERGCLPRSQQHHDPLPLRRESLHRARLGPGAHRHYARRGDVAHGLGLQASGAANHRDAGLSRPADGGPQRRGRGPEEGRRGPHYVEPHQGRLYAELSRLQAGRQQGQPRSELQFPLPAARLGVRRAFQSLAADVAADARPGPRRRLGRRFGQDHRAEPHRLARMAFDCRRSDEEPAVQRR